jgi:hypothetical protein
MSYGMTPMTPPRTPKEKKQQGGSKPSDRALGILVDQLRIVKAARSPIAFQLSSVVAEIFDAWQRSRGNRAEYDQLAEEAIRLAYEVTTRLEVMDSYMQVNLLEFLPVLDEIREYTKKCASRNRVKSFMLASFDVGEIKVQRQKLERCMRLFEFQSLPELREKTDKLVQRANNSNSSTSNSTGNTTSNSFEVGKYADFASAKAFAIGSGIAINSNSTNSGGVARSANNKGNTTTNLLFGDGAKFSGATGIALGSDHRLNINSNNNTKPQNFPGTNSDNHIKTQDFMAACTAPSTPRCSDSHDNNTTSNTASNITSFGNNANLSGASGIAFGSNNQISNNSNNTTDNRLILRSRGPNSVNFLNRGSNNQVHIGNMNSSNRGIIGNGSNNIVNSGNNSGAQFFPYASNFTLSDGEFSNVMGNATRNNYPYGLNMHFSNVNRSGQYNLNSNAMGVS